MTETVRIAAIQYEGKIHTGGRHITIIAQLYGEQGRYPYDRTEGFVTSTGRFVDRKEAAEIAYASGQTRQKFDFLYSEDIY